MESQAKLQGKVTSALAYPGLMVVIGTTLVSILMVVVVPNVTTIFAELDQALPWYTALLISISTISSSQLVGSCSRRRRRVNLIASTALGASGPTKEGARGELLAFS